MRYVPHTPDEIRDMLATIGVDSVADLFAPIPRDLQLDRPLELPEPLPECRLRAHLVDLAQRNLDTTRVASFSGAGLYQHYVPAAVGQLLLRSEFYTAYTPYQPEVSQGTLQSIFEYQTLIARLLDMDVSNASLYDGSTAVAEATGMALRHWRGKRKKVLFAGAVHPEYLAVTRTYLTAPDEIMHFVPSGADGRIDLAALEAAMDDQVAAVVVQSPNVLGLVEDLAQVRALSANHQSLLVTAFSEPLAFGLLKPPGTFGADIVVGEGQSFGLPLSYGGPLLGIMTARKKLVRQMPGRLVGHTTDRHGNDCFVVTLATREQHIRREKATSNICTNEGLCALAAAIYLGLLGKNGLRKLATLNHHASRHLAARLAAIPGVRLPYEKTPWFNEFVIELTADAETVWARMSDQGLVPGVPLGRLVPGADNRLLVNVTELNSPEQMNRYCELLAGLVG